MEQQSLFLLCQEDMHFAQKPVRTKESHEEVVRSVCRAESYSSTALPAPGPRGSSAEAGSFPLLFAAPAAPSPVSFLMLVLDSPSHPTQHSILFLLKLQSSLGHSSTPFAREAVPMWSSHSCSISQMVQTSPGSTLFPGTQLTPLQQRNKMTDS